MLYFWCVAVSYQVFDTMPFTPGCTPVASHTWLGKVSEGNIGVSFFVNWP